ncbi:MAG: hypothetical protein JXR97_05730 [Planctomycetes bacterium]|nr:hypothetical protein [Planctomycetota bacterium]
MDIAEKMDRAWDYIWEELFCEKTNLFYDYITSSSHDKRFDHLPHPDEIALQFPNPCGWGTGMEDSMLNAGSVMDILRLRYELTGDKNALVQAGKVLEGMALCTYVHGRPGFVARSVSPRDGQSCYINSSRDQFTLCVYAAWRFLHSFPDADPAMRDKAAKLLVDIAAYCENSINEESGYNLMRLDGKAGLVSGMADVQAHEIMRLPMFYGAAWYASKDEHWLKLCHHYALPGIEENLNLEPDRNWWDIEFSQMQLSLVLLEQVEQKESLREKYRSAIRLVAQMTEKYFRAELLKAEDFSGEWNRVNDVWRMMNMRIREEIMETPASSSVYGGYGYALPKFPPEYEEPYSLLRAIGNYMYVMALCPDITLDSAVVKSFAKIAAKPDYSCQGSDGPINVLHGYWLARGRGWI